MKKTRSCVVSLIGRPNVGKSTVFNRLMRKSYKAMTHDLPGVTRDRHYGIGTFYDKRDENPEDVIIVDTGGFYPEKIEEVKTLGKRKTAEPFFNIMADHARVAIAESDLILFVVDVREGLLPFDKTIADYIRTQKKPMWLLVNKFDSDAQWGAEADFYELGLHEDQFFIISAEHARGLDYIREGIHEFSKKFAKTITETEEIQKGVKPNHDVVSNIALIGAPNAGKSTLLNQLVGAQRALVSSIAGTTVDPIEGYFDLFFGDDVTSLKAQKNEFRKDNTALYKELLTFEESFEETELIAYDKMPKNLLDYSDHDYPKESEEEDEEEMVVSSELEENDLISIEDMAKNLDAQNLDNDDDEEASEETVSFDKEEKENPYRSIKIVDTAGIRKQANVTGFIEEQSVYRSLRAISESDIVIYMIDATKGISHQDRRLCDVALEKGKSIIICLNKVDLIPEIMNDQKRKREWLLDLRATIPWLGFCEMLTISAKKGTHLNSFRKSLIKTINIRSKKIGTSKLNKLVTQLIDRHPIILNKGANARFKVKYASMLKSTPPTFLLFTNKSKGVPATYRKYLQNGIRSEFKLINTPVHLIFRTTTDIEKRIKKSELQDF
jgi:GTP-binding protein